MMFSSLLLAALIQLPGVVGENLRVRAFFDANNVKVGDPMTLTIDFLGEADFKSLHPPELSPAVNRDDWKIYNESAKTDTYQDARRLTYRVRPMRKGVLWFPALEFGFFHSDGSKRTIRANTIPVHVKSSRQVVVDDMDKTVRMPEPPELISDAPSSLSQDELFAWRKACSKPYADAFTQFDFPAARFNEARCAILEGNWARALKLYAALEWHVGQSAEVERGIIAALARKYENAQAELPVWRQVGRPVLRYAWPWRLAIIAGVITMLALVFWLLGKIIRIAACIVVFAAIQPQTSTAQGIFSRMEAEMDRIHQQMRQSMGSSFSFGFGGQKEPIKVSAAVELSRKDIQVGDEFEFIVSLDAPKSCTLGQVRLTPSQMFGMTVAGQVRNLPEVESKNPSNSVRRLAVPVRYDVPLNEKISFNVSGMVSRRENRGRNGGFFSISSSTSFQADSKPVLLKVKPLPSDGAPADFGGVVSSGLQLREYLDLEEVETNDVICITYEMRSNGYVPSAFMLPDAAFEIARDNQRDVVSYRRFFVAAGTNVTPKVEISYYDPESKSYQRASCGGSAIRYRPSDE